MDNVYEHIDILIAKVALGEALPNEVQELTEWENQSDGNRLYVAQGKKVFDQIALVEVDTNAAWNKLKQRIDEGEEDEGAAVIEMAPKARRFNYYYLVAASIVLIVALTFTLKYLTQPAPDVTFRAASADVAVQKTMPDGSTVYLNKYATVDYKEDGKTGERKVVLTGEAYFNVKHDDKKPFVIETKEVLIKDVGTVFNVKSGAKTVEVFVESGVVEFYTATNKGLTLKQGEKGVYNIGTKTFAKEENAGPNAIAYKTRVFAFNNTKLSDVVAQLNSVYGNFVFIENDKLKDCTITVNFNNEDLETIISIIKQTLNIQSRKEQDRTVLFGEGC